MATTPLYAKAPFDAVGARIRLAPEPTVGDLDPALINDPGDTLTQLTTMIGWWKADIVDAPAGTYLATIEVSDGVGGWVAYAAERYDLLDTTDPVFPTNWVDCGSI